MTKLTRGKRNYRLYGKNGILRADLDIANAAKKAKTYKGEWYTINSILGNDWAIFYLLLGGREAGKSYSVMKWGVTRKLRHRSNFKFYWFRLTEAATKNLLADGGSKFVDPDIARKFGIKVERKGTALFTYKEREVKKSGKTTFEKYDRELFCDVLACSTFYNTKGVGYFDADFKGEYFIVLDEMAREESEANRFDIVYNFINLLENIARSTKNKIKVVMIGNTLQEASDLLSAFNFIPDNFGRYKLKRKRAVIDYIRPNKNYTERRKGTIADIVLPNASTFTNKIEVDRTLLHGGRVHSPTFTIKYTKQPDTWFTVWDDNIISQYNGDTTRATIPMRRYLDEHYDLDAVNLIIEQFDARGFKFRNLATFKIFEKQLKLLKKQ